MSRDLDELRAHLGDRMAPLLDAWIDESLLRAAITEATADWAVTCKDYPHRDDHPLAEVRYGHKLVATLPFVPETDDEAAEREAHDAARTWAARAALDSRDREDPGYFGDDVGPPPARVGILHLLDQGIWWRMRDPDATGLNDEGRAPTVAIRLEDMTHDHRLALLAFLRRNAPAYKTREDWYYASVPGPSGEMAQDAFQAECDRQWETPASEWIEEQPLVQALMHWTTPYAESPITWRRIGEVSGRPGFNAMVRCVGGTELSAFWNPEEWRWERSEDSAPLYVLDLEPLEWRELRDDEHQSPDQECEDSDDGTPVR